MDTKIINGEIVEVVQESKSLLSADFEIYNTLIDKFINSVDVSAKSKEIYRNNINRYVEYLKENNIFEPNKKNIIDYKNNLLNKGLKATTIQLYIIVVKQFYKYLSSENIYKNIADTIKGAKVARGFKKDYLSSNQARKLLNSIDRTNIIGIRDFALIALMISTGLRTVEIERALIGDIEIIHGDKILYIQGKGRTDKSEYIKLSDEVYRAIKEYLNMREDKNINSPLFSSTSNNSKNKTLSTRTIRKIVKERLKNIDIESDRITAHSLRHTCATLGIESGATIEQAQQLLRHSNINTTMIYNHSINRKNNDIELKISNVLFNNVV